MTGSGLPTTTRRGLLAGAGAAVTATVAFDPSAAEAATAGCPQPTSKLPMPKTRQLNVLVTGDAGSGTNIQYAVAKAARKLSRTTPIHLAIGLGDNVYEFGVTGTCDDDFITKFEQPNAGIDVPWMMVQGNHDNSSILIPGDAGDLTRGNHEVAYHRFSSRWYMPARYYGVSLPPRARSPLADFIVLDDNPVTAYLPQLNPYYSLQGKFMRDQRAWLRERLASTGARWTFVLSHHPYKNNGEHGEAGNYDGVWFLDPVSGRHFKWMIEEDVLGKADFLLAGHDHSLQHLDLGNARGRRTDQIVSGAAGKIGGKSARTRPNKALFETYDKAGFFLLKVRDDRVEVEAYTVNVATATATLAYRNTRRK